MGPSLGTGSVDLVNQADSGDPVVQTRGHTMNRALRTSTLAIAGLTTTGLVAFTTPAIAGDDGERASVFKREDDGGSVVATADDDDADDDARGTGTNTNTKTGGGGGDGTNSNTNSHAGAGTGDSRSRADNTNSRVTKVSRDRDRSRGDLTRDWTKDGGTWTRDRSANHTNDRSRNDTRR